MEKIINNKPFINLRNDMDEIINQFKSIENDVNQDVYEKYQLNQYEQIIEGNDENVLQQYKTWYEQLEKVVINKNNAIQQSNESINQIIGIIEYIKKLTDTNYLQSIVNKEMNNANIMINYLNQIVDKIREKETIQNKREKQEFEEKKTKEQYIEEIKFKKDIGLEQFNMSIQSLFEWSGKQNYNIIFDSDLDGDGKGVLENKVIHKRNLYFISFDNENNIFGGYVDTIINKTGRITDPNAFVFSLIKNGKMKNIKYNIKNNQQKNVFCLNSNYVYLYLFGRYDGEGRDILTPKIGFNSEYICKPVCYEYNGEQQPLRNNTRYYTMKRILVLEMN
ncbi:TLDc domain-containing protein [Entamoeba marina]